MTITEQFLSYLTAQAGSIYVWGTQGETEITEDWIRRRETSEANAARAIALWRRRLEEGMHPIAAYDCSGLIVRFLLDKGLAGDDLSSRGLYHACERLATRQALQPGDLLFRHNGERVHHVGVYLGEDRIIEARGREDGVVIRTLKECGSSYWNRYGRLTLLRGQAERGDTLPAEYQYSGGTYANLRTGPGLEYEAISRVNRGDRVLALSIREGWAEVIKRENGYLRGWCISDYLKPL